MRKLEVSLHLKTINNMITFYDGHNEQIESISYDTQSVIITRPPMNALYFRVNDGQIRYLYFDLVSTEPHIVSAPKITKYGIQGNLPIYKIDYQGSAIARYEKEGNIWYEMISGHIYAPSQDFAFFDVTYCDGVNVSTFTPHMATIPGLGFLLSLFFFLLDHLGFQYIVLIVLMVAVVMIGIFFTKCGS